jgi:hypothetical protein
MIRGVPREDVTLADRIAAQDEVIGALQEAGDSGIMDQPNTAGKAPPELLEETRARLRADEERRRRLLVGRGRSYLVNQR